MIQVACPKDHDLLPFVSGEPVAVDVRDHLDGCSDCRSRLEQMIAEVESLRRNIQEGMTLSGFSHVADDRAETEDADPSDFDFADPGERLAPAAGRPVAIGKYLVVAELDTGGQAEVYRVVHPTLSKDLVLKLSKRACARDRADRDLLVAEGKLLGDLEHPNMVRIFDLDFDHDDRPFLVMEYVRGRNLQQEAAQQRPTPRQAAAWVAQVARALAMVHRRGIVHQDIKPKNILIDESRRPRLIDFGLARWQHAWAQDSDPPGGGTLAFMAPEQARDEQKRIGPCSDIFALGGVLYFLLTAQSPFRGQSKAEVWGRAARCDFDRAALRSKDIPRRLERICLRAMAAEPAERYASAEALAGALEAYLRRPVVVGSLAVLLLIPALAVGAWSHWPSSTPALNFSMVIQPPPAVAVPLSGEVNIWIWDPSDPTRQRLALNDPGAMPLRAGDRIRVEARVNQSAYLYLVWIDVEGVAEPVYPWKPGDWSRLAVEEHPVTQLSLPTVGKGWPIKKSRSGMETLVLLARELPLDVELKSQLADLPRPALQDTRSLVWFDDWVVVRNGASSGRATESRDRGPSFFEVDIKDPVLQTQELLKERLKNHFSMVRAVSFANQGG